MTEPAATVLITTRNRKGDLLTALASAVRQTAPVEILVIDDGSTDGTDAAVRMYFPEVRYVRHEECAGYIVRRNEGARLARGPVIISMDDDAEFSDVETVARTLAEFSDFRIGAVAIPFVDVNKSPAVHQLAPDDRDVYVTSAYVGTAHAVRADVFNRVGGYREYLYHQGEEGDFCIRMLAAGFVVRLGNAPPIRHYESPKRDFERMDLYGRRNDVLFAWYNVPLLWLPIHLAMTSLKGMWWGVKVGRKKNMLRGLKLGFASIGKVFGQRRPVPGDVYSLFRMLKRRGPIPFLDMAHLLHPAVMAGWGTALAQEAGS